MSSEWTARDMHALGTHHAQVETERDLEATMATLVEDPVYELWPVGLRMQGRDRVTRRMAFGLCPGAPVRPN